jgi:hypothetical protein
VTPEAQRIAIGDACGWYPTPEGHWTTNPAGRNTAGYIWTEELPDYLNSLDAMHEAEKQLKSDIQRDRYTRMLMVASDDIFPLWHAAAAERAEAFLCTLNLWKD